MGFQGLRFKINGAITATCLLVALAFGAIVYPFEMSRRASRFEEIRTLVSAVFEQRREEIANEIYARQDSALASSLRSIKEVKGIAKVIVFGLGGRVIAATEPGLEEAGAPQGPMPALKRTLLAGHPYAVYSAPIEVIGDTVGTIKLFYDLQPQRREGLYVIAVSLLLLGSILGLISLVLNELLRRFVLRPTLLLRNALTRLQDGNLGEQVPLISQDEIGEVGAAFNVMSSMLARQHHALTLANRDLEDLNARLETLVQERTAELSSSNLRLQEEMLEKSRVEAARRELEERLVRSQKMEALGLLAGGVGHDLNNVLSGVVSYPDFLLVGMPDDHPLRKAITTIRDSGLKAAAIVQDLLALARRGVMQTCVLDLNQDIIQDYLLSPEFAGHQARHPGIRIETCLDPGLMRINGSPVHLKKSVMNLVINAMEAQPEGGAIRIATANLLQDGPLEGPCVRLRIEDDGVGISPEDQKKIFEPFYTRKVMGRSGTGLGMTVVWGTVQDHHGCITLRSELGRGSTFDLYFPATTDLAQPAGGSLPAAAYQGHGERILVVDDLEEQRTLASEVLVQLNYQAVTVPSGEAALDYLRTGSADLVLLDMIMDPGMDGLATYREILRLHPGQKAIILSGFAESDRVLEAISLGAGGHLKKPFTIESLGQALRNELDPTVPG
jgi:signal transduction histidine kinase/ActR/RegA family two-component response regulator